MSFNHKGFLNFGWVGAGAMSEYFKLFKLFSSSALKALLARVEMFIDGTVRLTASSFCEVKVLIDSYAERLWSYTIVMSLLSMAPSSVHIQLFICFSSLDMQSLMQYSKVHYIIIYCSLLRTPMCCNRNVFNCFFFYLFYEDYSVFYQNYTKTLINY